MTAMQLAKALVRSLLEYNASCRYFRFNKLKIPIQKTIVQNNKSQITKILLMFEKRLYIYIFLDIEN